MFQLFQRPTCPLLRDSSDQSYLDYLKMDVSDVPPTPLEAQQAKRKLVDKLLERELQVKKQPVRRKEPEEVKKEPVEQE